MKRALMAWLIAPIALSLLILGLRYDELSLAASTSSTSLATPPPQRVSITANSSKPTPTPVPTIAGGIATFERTATLASVAEACAATANESQAGAVVLKKGAQQQTGRVTFTVPCAIQLQGDSIVSLQDMTIVSKTLNFSDTAFGAGENKFVANNTNWTGGSGAGLLVKFSDPTDEVEVARSQLTYPLGIVIQARGDRTEPDSGGIVKLNNVRLSSHSDLSDGITVTASTSKGVVKATDSLFDAEQVGIMADLCRVQVESKFVDCNASALAADLKAQAEAAAAEQAAAQR